MGDNGSRLSGQDEPDLAARAAGDGAPQDRQVMVCRTA
jgi:hypothetical protein